MKAFPWSRSAILAALLSATALAACSDNSGGDAGTAPEAPVGVKLCRATNIATTVTWTPVAGATGYVIERAVGAGAAYGLLTTVTDGATGNYLDGGLTPDVQYYYRIRATNADGNSAASDAMSFTASSAANVIAGDITCDLDLSSAANVGTKKWKLRGYVKVKNGATITIPAGDTIVGDKTLAGSSLWILRGAKINANGTSVAPIIMTSENTVGNRKPGDWGGLIVVGNATINRTGTILTEGPPGISEVFSGGSDDNDSSGVIRYVRVEFAGYDVSGGAGQELNSFSLYAVGRRTVLEYLEANAGLDDSFEWFGGTVDGRYLVSYESGDDHFDFSQGYRGRNQFLIGFQTTNLAPAPGRGTLSSDPQMFEGDGCAIAEGGCGAGEGSTPFTEPVFANFTIVGAGAGDGSASGGFGLLVRRGSGGYFGNGIIARFKARGMTIRDTSTYNRFKVDSLQMANLLFAQNTGGNYDPGADSAIASPKFGQQFRFAAKNHVESTDSASAILTDIDPAGGLDWKPQAGKATGAGTVTFAPASRVTSFFGGTLPQNTTYFGAADPTAGTGWWSGWTAYAAN